MEINEHLIALTKREREIMKILWESPVPMIISEIAAASPELTINTTQALIRKLLKNGLIAIDKIVYSHTVLSRSFKPVYTEKDYVTSKFVHDYNALEKKVSIADIFCALLASDTTPEEVEQDMAQLAEILKKHKKDVVFSDRNK